MRRKKAGGRQLLIGRVRFRHGAVLTFLAQDYDVNRRRARGNVWHGHSIRSAVVKMTDWTETEELTGSWIYVPTLMLLAEETEEHDQTGGGSNWRRSSSSSAIFSHVAATTDSEYRAANSRAELSEFHIRRRCRYDRGRSQHLISYVTFQFRYDKSNYARSILIRIYAAGKDKGRETQLNDAAVHETYVAALRNSGYWSRRNAHDPPGPECAHQSARFL